MTSSPPSPPLPDVAEWARLGLEVGAEMHAGHQSRVFRAIADGRELIVKLTDETFVDGAFFDRLRLVADLGAVDERVVGPVRLGDSLWARIGGWWAAAYPFVPGRVPVITAPNDVVAMASTLAALHRSFRDFNGRQVPVVAALQPLASPPQGFGPSQLLHGDFSAANVLLTDVGVRVLDFADVGYGSIEFEIGNTLYMALFDATMSDTLDEYEQFRRWFMAAYDDAAGTALDPQVVDVAIALRRAALRAWLDDLATAPIGIRTATAEWRRELRRFAEGDHG